MLFWLWLALALALGAVVASAIFAGSRGLALWRQFKGSSAALGEGLGSVTAAADAVAERAGGLGDGTERLAQSLARLSVSRTKLNVLRDAWSDATATFGRIGSVVPREKKA